MASRLKEEMEAALHGKEGEVCAEEKDPAPIEVCVSPPMDDSYGPYHGGVRFASLDCFADHACKPPEELIRGEHEWNQLDQRWTPSEEAADLLDLPGGFPQWMMGGEGQDDDSDEGQDEDGDDDDDDAEEEEVDADAFAGSEEDDSSAAGATSPARSGSALEALEGEESSCDDAD